MESLPLSCCDPVLMLCSVAHDLAKGRHPPRQRRVSGRALQPYAQRIADNDPSPSRGCLAALPVSETMAEWKARAMNGVLQALALQVFWWNAVAIGQGERLHGRAGGARMSKHRLYYGKLGTWLLSRALRARFWWYDQWFGNARASCSDLGLPSSLRLYRNQ